MALFTSNHGKARYDDELAAQLHGNGSSIKLQDSDNASDKLSAASSEGHGELGSFVDGAGAGFPLAHKGTLLESVALYQIVAVDKDRASYEVGAAVIEKAGLSHKIDFREGFILPQLDKMLLEEKNHGFFDFVFVDADKENYVKYHERVMKLVKEGGVIGYDNTLWAGSLAAPEGAQYSAFILHYRPFVLEFNRVLAADRRIEISQLPLGDGITVCRRIE